MPRTYLAQPPLALRPNLASGLWWKRPLDLAVGPILLLLALPLILFLALVVMLESPGPAFFGQERVGYQGRRFRMWKLRTMLAGCDQAPHRRTVADWFRGQAEPGNPYKTLADARITRVGHLLRLTNLDELPQLFNVVRGDMSLVGPRPAIPYELPHYQAAYFDRLNVPPGITGLWQVTDRDRLSADQMMQLDLRYVREASPWLDLKVLAMTAPALLASAVRGA